MRSHHQQPLLVTQPAPPAAAPTPLNRDQGIPPDLPEWRDPRWQALPYHSVLAVLPGGSSFYLPGEKLAWFAARMIAHPDIAIRKHLTEQIMPVVEQTPGALLEFARRLPWSEARQLAEQPMWRSPVDFTGAKLWPQAQLSLCTFRF